MTRLRVRMTWCGAGMLAGMLAIVILGSAMGGCERQLFKDTDTRASEARLKPFGTYDSESVQASRERRKQAREWGFGIPGMNSGGGI